MTTISIGRSPDEDITGVASQPLRWRHCFRRIKSSFGCRREGLSNKVIVVTGSAFVNSFIFSDSVSGGLQELVGLSEMSGLGAVMQGDAIAGGCHEIRHWYIH